MHCSRLQCHHRFFQAHIAVSYPRPYCSLRTVLAPPKRQMVASRLASRISQKSFIYRITETADHLQCHDMQQRLGVESVGIEYRKKTYNSDENTEKLSIENGILESGGMAITVKNETKERNGMKVREKGNEMPHRPFECRTEMKGIYNTPQPCVRTIPTAVYASLLSL